MTKDELLAELAKLHESRNDDFETAHSEADDLIIAYIDDSEITAAYDGVGKWYS